MNCAINGRTSPRYVSPPSINYYHPTYQSILTLSSNAGPRTHIPHPHPPRNRPPKIPPNDLPLRRRQRLRRRPSPRPLPTNRPQNNVPTHRLARRKHPTPLLRRQTPPQQLQTALRPRQRPPLLVHTHRYKGGHDGDFPDRCQRPAKGA